MKIKLIIPKEPSGENLFDPSPTKASGIHFFNSTIAYLAALTSPEIEVELVDLDIEEINYDEKVDLVGITLWTRLANSAYATADEFKKRGVPVVLGGNHASLMPEEAINHADTIVVGEGEEIWPSLLKDFKKINHLNNGIVKAKEKHDLKNLPVPRYELYKNYEEYIPLFGLFATRGCPFKCYFCSDSKFNGGIQRRRPIEEVIEWANCYRKNYLSNSHHPRPDLLSICFTDTNLWVNTNYAKELFNALIPLKITWTSQGSITAVKHPDIIKLAAESGCREMAVGFETIDPITLKKDINKLQNKIEEYEHFISLMKKSGISIRGTFMFGNDNDGLDTFEKTLDFIEKNRIEIPLVMIATPFPGTQFYEKLEEENRIFERDWSYYNCLNLVFYPNIDKKVFKKHFIEFFDRLYSEEGINKRLKDVTSSIPWSINETLRRYVNSFDKEKWINA